MSREKPKKIKVSVGSRIFDTVNLIFLILLGLTTFYPFWDCLVVSFSSLKSYLATNIHLWPDEWSFEGYAYMLKSFDLWRSYANSIFITVVGTLINMLITTMAVCAVEKGFKGTAVLHVSGSVYDDVYRRNYSDLHRCKGSASDEFAVGDDPAVGGQHLQPDYFKKLLLGASDGAGGSGAFGRMYGDRRIV